MPVQYAGPGLSECRTAKDCVSYLNLVAIISYFKFERNCVMCNVQCA